MANPLGRPLWKGSFCVCVCVC